MHNADLALKLRIAAAAEPYSEKRILLDAAAREIEHLRDDIQARATASLIAATATLIGLLVLAAGVVATATG
jgi:hypothetical protein